jgi:hypothetical protein
VADERVGDAMRKAPAEIQRIVWAVLRSGPATCILIEPEPLGEIKSFCEMAEGPPSLSKSS